MDLLSHGLTGAAIMTIITGDPNKLVLGGLLATAPDLINGIPSHIVLLWCKRKEIKEKGFSEALKIGTVERWKDIPIGFMKLYQILHSIWFTVFVSALLWVYFDPIWAFAFASHFLVDIWLHQETTGLKFITAIMPFFPFSRWTCPIAIRWWDDVRLPSFFYTLLLLIIILRLQYFSLH